MKITIEPMGYVRRTRADAWKQREVVLRYYAYLDELRLRLKNFKLGNSFEVTFGLPFPKSYTQKEKAKLLGKPHQVRPDLDNLLKAFNDGLRGKGENNDSRIYYFKSSKVWSEEGFIEVNNI